MDDTAQMSRERYFGKYPGVVIENTAESGAHLGKVKVRVPGILEEDDSGAHQPIEVIARPCFPPGFFFVPEEGAHVWVEFAAGDVDHPIWVGVWYPEEAPPPTASGDQPTEKQKVIRTQSHTITLDDDAKSLTVKNHDGEGSRVELFGDRAVVHATTIELGESAENGLLMHTQMVEQYLTSHQHLGNMGAPTGGPFPPIVPPTLETWFTRTTKAK